MDGFDYTSTRWRRLRASVLRAAGYRVEALAPVKSMKEGVIEF